MNISLGEARAAEFHENDGEYECARTDYADAYARVTLRCARARVEKLLTSGYIIVEDISELIEIAADYKCDMAISLLDCFTLSLGKEGSLPVLFAWKEKELTTEMERKPFDLDILVLEDYT